MGILRESIKGIFYNKLFSFLMIVGLIISTFAMSSIIIISNGTKYEIIKILKSFGFGYDSILILAGPGKLFSHQKKRTTTLKLKDAQLISRLSFVKGVSPFNRVFGITVSSLNNSTKADLLGVYPQYKDLHQYPILYGRFINRNDINKKSKVCVIGKTIIEKLFKTNNLNKIGEYIKINNLYFKIIGVYKPKGRTSRFDIDNRILIPLSTFNNILFHYDYIKGMKVIVDNTEKLEEKIKQIGLLLRKSHNLKSFQNDDFRIITSKDIIDFVNSSTEKLTRILLFISVISFIISGLTITSIMLTSIFQRIKEIGIKRTFGATKLDIILQFLMESTIISTLGSLIGLFFSILILKLLSQKFPLKILITYEPFIISIFFGITVGILFGLYPAKKGANLDPVEALKI